MKGKSGKGPNSTDLFVCFPTRAHLTLMPPKSISSPVRPSETSKHHHHHHHHHHNHHLRRRSFGVGQGSSPTLWSKNKPIMNTDNSSEPTSPKVTCAGQIKVRPKTNSSCNNWQSVMEEIERIHNKKKEKKKKHSWVETLGFKKDVMQFLTCMRNIRFDFRCFGAFPATEITSDDEDEEEEDYDDHYTNDDYQEKHGIGQHGQLQDLFRYSGVAAADGEEEKESSTTSRTVFSKWFMVLHEDSKKEKTFESYRKSSSDEIIAPPPNALLLMRCRSAPPKSWLEEDKEEEQEQEQGMEKKDYIYYQETEIQKSENLIMRYGSVENDFCKFSSDIAKETWIVDGIKDSLSRSKSWKN